MHEHCRLEGHARPRYIADTSEAHAESLADLHQAARASRSGTGQGYSLAVGGHIAFIRTPVNFDNSYYLLRR